MALRFTPKFTVTDIRRAIEKRVAVIENATLDQIKQVGEQFVIDARSTQTYKDRTRNLRGSIGYIIFKDGERIFGNFISPKKVTAKNNDEPVEPFVGKTVGEQLALSVGAETKGYVLVVVAGMNYAGFVEAKGYDVLTGSGLTAESNLKKAIGKIQDRLKRIK